jgi:hypothetical protein
MRRATILGQVEADNIAKGVPVTSPLLGQLNDIASRLPVSPLGAEIA